MSPRSSRSHSTLVPADSMIASTPQVTWPSRRHATIGNVPPSPRVSNARTLGADDEVEHPAGAEGDLRHAAAEGSPGRSATPAGRRRCRRSVARRRARWPRRRRPTSRRSVGIIAGGMFSNASVLSSQPLPSPCIRPVTAALVRSVTWRAPPDSVQAIQVSTVPKHRSRLRSGSYMSSRNAQLRRRRSSARRASPCSRKHEALADGAQVLPADARADGLARWRGPTRSSTPAGS